MEITKQFKKEVQKTVASIGLLEHEKVSFILQCAKVEILQQMVDEKLRSINEAKLSSLST